MHSDGDPSTPYHLCLLAGVKTYPGFFDSLYDALAKQPSCMQINKLQIHVLYPYGDYRRSIVRQVAAACVHWTAGQLPQVGSMGRQLAEGVLQIAPVERLLLLGHSAGGIACCLAARQIYNMTGKCPPFIQIGSPRMRMAPIISEHAYAVIGDQGHPDWLSRIGTWGGWERQGSRWYYRKDRHAPKQIVEETFLGGHTDYFRNHPPFVDGYNQSNADKIAALICRISSSNRP